MRLFIRKFLNAQIRGGAKTGRGYKNYTRGAFRHLAESEHCLIYKGFLVLK